jgi:hypothetical protein
MLQLDRSIHAAAPRRAAKVVRGGRRWVGHAAYAAGSGSPKNWAWMPLTGLSDNLNVNIFKL